MFIFQTPTGRTPKTVGCFDCSFVACHSVASSSMQSLARHAFLDCASLLLRDGLPVLVPKFELRLCWRNGSSETVVPIWQISTSFFSSGGGSLGILKVEV